MSPDPWALASANVIGCALAWRAKAMLAGDKASSLDGSDAIRDLIDRSTKVAKEAYAAVGAAPCEPSCRCGRCYEVAILIALSTQWSIISGQSKSKIFTEALKEFDAFMKGRS